MAANCEEANKDLSVIKDAIDEKASEDVTTTGEARIISPKKDMVFGSYDMLLGFYKEYAAQVGFEVVKRRTSKDDDGEVKYVTVACSRNGNRPSKSQNYLNPRPTSKTKCQARINAVLRDDGSWKVSGLVLDHNHPLLPSKSHFGRSNRHMTPGAQRRIELIGESEININITSTSLVGEFGGGEKMTFLDKDCQKHIDNVRRLRFGDGDANALQNYLMKVQVVDNNFFYAIDLDEDNRLRNLFWADGRCKAAYEEFGDVITFDTTYLANKFDMPFAPFVGVNHHGQSTLLGCAIISSEDIQTFTWLFNAWLTCMNGHPPDAIITDQDIAMKNAIEIVFPNARHRWCLWRIMEKLPKKLRAYKECEGIKALLQNIVYDSLTPIEFEIGWSEMIRKYKLEENSWLMALYDERDRWIPCFVEDCFLAGMSTTQRGENMRAFFDGYVNSKTTLKQFVEKYENAMRKKVEIEDCADWVSFNSHIPLVTFYAMEKQVQQVYTIAKFKEFQKELTGMMYCRIYCSESHGVISEYGVDEDKLVGDNELRRVRFKVCLIREEGDEFEVKCNCRLFEFRGILCRHALYVLTDQEKYNVPAKYIIRRWRKDVSRRHSKVRVPYSDWSVTVEGRRFDMMCMAFHEVASLAAEFDDKCNVVMEWVQEIKGKVSNNDGLCGSSPSSPKSKTTDTGRPVSKEICVTPLSGCDKEHPPCKRKQSKVENIVRRLQKVQKSSRATTTTTKHFDDLIGVQVGKGTDEEKMKTYDATNVVLACDVIGTQESFNTEEPRPAQYFQSGIQRHMLPVHYVAAGNNLGAGHTSVMLDHLQKGVLFLDQPPRGSVAAPFSNQARGGEVATSSSNQAQRGENPE